MTCSLARNPIPNNLPEVKLLGFIIDPKLTWEKHTMKVCTKLSRTLHLFRKLKPMLTKQYLLTVYFALFHSHLSYGLEVWGHAAGCKDVLLLQKKAVRLISSADYHEHCRPLFSKLNILTVYSQYILITLNNVRTNISSLALREDQHDHNTRSKSNLDLPFCRLNKKKDSFPMLAIRMYNRLPLYFKNLEASVFKNELREWLLARPLYSLDEFYKICV